MELGFLILLNIATLWGVYGQHSRCLEGSCYPATGDLLIGREKKLYASSTCGLKEREHYCIVSHLKDVKKCFYCDSRQAFSPFKNQPLNHRIENIVYSFGRRKRGRWWQAQNGKEDVYIQLDLEAEFQFTHLIMRFKTFRPAAMLVERSYDFGKTWKVYRYFAENCAQSFPGVSTGPIKRLDQVICESKYSDAAPSTRGEVVFQVLSTSISIGNPYSSEVQDLLKLTNLRINFTKLHTLGDVLLHDKGETKKKYYYAMYDMTVRGSCSCYGHSSHCSPISVNSESIGITARDMVHGKCNCTHRTTGFNCERCEDFYNDLPWRPAREKQPNACRKCNCNNHATKCHFDPAVYELTGRVSGGVCDNCTHNTMGRNCQFCKPFFYQDPNRAITDYDVCRHCDCDPSGSEKGGECHGYTSNDGRYESGKCDCKRHVTGRRCDTCENGFWNLQKDNPTGCEACVCNDVGTSPGNSCDKTSGNCLCKRYVTGKQCDQCFPGYWGLSDDINGCKPCECDIGGSFSETCDQATGQCKCRPNIYGRKCDRPVPLYFSPSLDILRFEAEFSHGLGNAHVVIKEIDPDKPISFTGSGFMKVLEGDTIDFTVTNLTASMDYDIVIRYNPLMPEAWEDIRVVIDRPGPVNQSGPCANTVPQNDYKSATLSPDARFSVVQPPSCLEKGVTYTIKLIFNRYRTGRPTPRASALIDSVVLIPSTNSIPIFQGPRLPSYLKNEYIRYRCAETQYPANHPKIPDICKSLFFSISSVLHLHAIKCDCDLTGSVNAECDDLGGHCHCKENVVGRRCDQCAPGTYNFGPDGCSPCNCDPQGSRNNFCNPQSGNCLCAPNVEGRTCDRCIDGYWNFPNCRKCQCNGMAETCNNDDGHCINCQEFTTGQYCDRCRAGYYQDPRVTGRIACQSCYCPNGPQDSNQRADSCSFDLQKQSVVCYCHEGYSGRNCDTCAQNYFGSAEDGTCKKCDCNGNIDHSVPESCDSKTGKCLKCRFHTTGFNCEHCESNYFGDATQQSCQACVCNYLGTNSSSGLCDRVSGQCHCHPNVIGSECDQCAANHWNIASGDGCEPCGCDPMGSFSQQCNQIDGQCQCKTGRGGRTCSDCEDYYWGDPSVQCFPCNCSREGSISTQCSRRTGQCTCISGVTGHNCDKCARGTIGKLPNCKSCGECFDNWDKVVHDLSVRTQEMVDKVKNISITGAAGAFEEEFRAMRQNLDEVRQIIDDVGGSPETVAELDKMLEAIKSNLSVNNRLVENAENKLHNTTKTVFDYKRQLATLEQDIEGLREKARQLNASAQAIKENDYEGAYNITLAAKQKSDEAADIVSKAMKTARESERNRVAIDNAIKRDEGWFKNKLGEEKSKLDELDRNVGDLDEKLMDINQNVCGKRGDPCDSLCGGGGCDKCGGFGCEGATTKAENALDFAKAARDKLNERSSKIPRIVNKLNEIKDKTMDVKQDVKSLYDDSMNAKNKSTKARDELEKMLKEISDLLNSDKAKLDEVKKLAEDTLNMKISLKPDEIRRLSAEINKTVNGLKNIDDILKATEKNLALTKELKNKADNASKKAENVLGTANDVLDALKEANSSQVDAHDAIEKAENDIKALRSILRKIEQSMSDSENKARPALDTLKNLISSLDQLKNKQLENTINKNQADSMSKEAMDTAEKAEKLAAKLENTYNRTSETLKMKYNATFSVKKRVTELQKRANDLSLSVSKKNRDLRELMKSFQQRNVTVTNLSEEINELNKKMGIYLQSIQERAKYYANCQAQ
ncbi:laminin subunit beta-1-like [Argonauta hians]